MRKRKKNKLITQFRFIISLSVLLSIHSCGEKCDDSRQFQYLIRAVIDDPNLEAYYTHKNGKPLQLVIAADKLERELRLTKFDQPVLILSADEIKSRQIKAHISFDSLAIRSDSAYVIFRYRVQGIVSKNRYVWINCKWKLVSSRFGQV